MRERNQTAPRRRGPKLPLPQARNAYDSNLEANSESPYYSIDNTEDIYGTTLHPSQRCYVDPWDLENYDYVRKKLDSTPSPSPYYEASLSPAPLQEAMMPEFYGMPEQRPHDELSYELAPRMATTMPRSRRRSSHFQCELDCCMPLPSRRPYGDIHTGRELYGTGKNRYEDYMYNMAENMVDEEDVEQNIYTGYGGFSSSSSTEPHSSIGDDSASRLMLHTSGFRTATPNKRGVTLPKPQPKLEFPDPPSMPPTYDYCNPYATLPYCSVSDCYECISQAQHSASLIYAAPSVYGTASIYGRYGPSSYSDSTLGRRPSSSLYSGIYGNKFGLSKKGLLQIDYSCSWNDLDRAIGRNH